PSSSAAVVIRRPQAVALRNCIASSPRRSLGCYLAPSLPLQPQTLSKTASVPPCDERTWPPPVRASPGDWPGRWTGGVRHVPSLASPVGNGRKSLAHGRGNRADRSVVGE